MKYLVKFKIDNEVGKAEWREVFSTLEEAIDEIASKTMGTAELYRISERNRAVNIPISQERKKKNWKMVRHQVQSKDYSVLIEC